MQSGVLPTERETKATPGLAASKISGSLWGPTPFPCDLPALTPPASSLSALPLSLNFPFWQPRPTSSKSSLGL